MDFFFTFGDMVFINKNWSVQYWSIRDWQNTILNLSTLISTIKIFDQRCDAEFSRDQRLFFFFLGWISTHQSQNKDKIKGNLDTFESWLNTWKLNKTIDYFNKLLFKINYSNTLTNLELYYYSLLNHSSK